MNLRVLEGKGQGEFGGFGREESLSNLRLPRQTFPCAQESSCGCGRLNNLADVQELGVRLGYRS